MTPALPARLAGAIWGHLVGDAVGVPYEFRAASEIRDIRFGATGTHRQPPGTWSDDGALMLALLDSLLTNGFDTIIPAQAPAVDDDVVGASPVGPFERPRSVMPDMIGPFGPAPRSTRSSLVASWASSLRSRVPTSPS
jgi:hypothetical protein